MKAGKKLEAVEKLKEAAAAGSGVAADQLGHILHVGDHGTEKDIDAALGYYKMAAEIEHPQQMHSLLWYGNMLIEQKKDVKGAQASWEKCAARLKHYVAIEAGRSGAKDVRFTQQCTRKLMETLTCGDKSKKCEEFGPDAVQDFKKAFDYFLMMAGAMADPPMKSIAAKALKSGQWYPPGWKDESVPVTIDEKEAERFEAEHANIVETRKQAKEKKMKMAPPTDRAKQHAMDMKGKKKGKKGKNFKGKKGKFDLPHEEI
jgi:TPR repeat protein